MQQFFRGPMRSGTFVGMLNIHNYGAETGIFQENKFNKIAVDALAT